MPLPFSNQVLIAPCGATAAGICAALSLRPADGSDAVTFHDLSVPAAEGCAPLVSLEQTSAASPVQLMNIGASAQPRLSVVVINTEAPAEKHTRLAHEVVSLLPAGCSVGLLAGVPQQRSGHQKGGQQPLQGLAAVLLGGLAQAPAALPVAPGDQRVGDGLVAALAHFLHASQIPTCCVLAPSALGAAMDQAQPWGADAQLLGDAASRIFPSAGVAFSGAVAKNCRAERALGRGAEQDLGGGDLMYV